MTTWTLDHNTYKYYSTIGELIVWGDPEDGDEVVINNNFSYIFKPSSIVDIDYTWKIQKLVGTTITYRDPSHIPSQNHLPTIGNETLEANINEILNESHRMIVGNIEPGREETELEVYMREANQFR